MPKKYKKNLTRGINSSDGFGYFLENTDREDENFKRKRGKTIYFEIHTYLITGSCQRIYNSDFSITTVHLEFISPYTSYYGIFNDIERILKIQRKNIPNRSNLLKLQLIIYNCLHTMH